MDKEGNDITLAERIRTGDATAEQELFLRFGPRIAAKVKYQLSGRPGEQEDVTSEVYIAVLRSIRKGYFDPEKGITLGSYIYGVVRNKLKDYFKSEKRKPATSSMAVEEIDIPYFQKLELEKEELRKVLRTLLDNLDPKYGEVLHLKFYEELTVAEISKKMGIEPRRVSERLHYALTLLRKSVKKSGYFSISLLFCLIYGYQSILSKR